MVTDHCGTCQKRLLSSPPSKVTVQYGAIVNACKCHNHSRGPSGIWCPSSCKRRGVIRSHFQEREGSSGATPTVRVVATSTLPSTSFKVHFGW